MFEPRRDSRWPVDPAEPARQLASGAPRASVRWLTWNLNCRSRRRGTHRLRSARRAPLEQLISQPPGDSSIGGRNGPLPSFWLPVVRIAAQSAADLVGGRPCTALLGMDIMAAFGSVRHVDERIARRLDRLRGHRRQLGPRRRSRRPVSASGCRTIRPATPALRHETNHTVIRLPRTHGSEGFRGAVVRREAAAPGVEGSRCGKPQRRRGARDGLGESVDAKAGGDRQRTDCDQPSPTPVPCVLAWCP